MTRDEFLSSRPTPNEKKAGFPNNLDMRKSEPAIDQFGAVAIVGKIREGKVRGVGRNKGRKERHKTQRRIYKTAKPVRKVWT